LLLDTFFFSFLMLTNVNFVFDMMSKSISAAGAAKPVLHDLNLRVTREGSGSYVYPNGLTAPDTNNNIEKVRCVTIATLCAILHQVHVLVRFVAAL
jgi:hypothetical protein